MNKRQTFIDQTNGGIKSQSYYWEEWEWIQSDDVIFGVQMRQPGTTAQGTAMDAMADERAESSELFRRVPQSVIADEYQKKCLMCGDAFKQDWSDDEESWMYKNCLRVTPELGDIAEKELHRLNQAEPQPTSADESKSEGESAQSIAAQSKEEDRLNNIYRYQKILHHLRAYQDRILHQECHYGLLQSIMKSKRPQPPASVNANATVSDSIKRDPEAPRSPQPMQDEIPQLE